MKNVIYLVVLFVYTVFIAGIWYCKGYTNAEADYNNDEWGPKAIDVYQGKTTLQYTVINGEKVDSIVVFKK